MLIILWKGNSTVGYPKVAWSSVCRPIEEGGLGIRDILALNKALMCRHIWNVIQDNQSSIWCDGLLTLTSDTNPYGRWTLKGGLWGWTKLLRLRSALLPYIDFKIGDGASFSLWHDPWHSSRPADQKVPEWPQQDEHSCGSNTFDGYCGWSPSTITVEILPHLINHYPSNSGARPHTLLKNSSITFCQI
ncbi:putative ribonuclease H protein [Sesamum angolense]|uniref:Ribonuclease H protein n=1 Tax=Sesamum angolense TaxID=2727404 RepID=A0AAE1T4I5_9LAMI|nr:putative ribonuclease H protein [Sesamum angolense]